LYVKAYKWARICGLEERTLYTEKNNKGLLKKLDKMSTLFKGRLKEADRAIKKVFTGSHVNGRVLLQGLFYLFVFKDKLLHKMWKVEEEDAFIFQQLEAEW